VGVPVFKKDWLLHYKKFWADEAFLKEPIKKLPILRKFVKNGFHGFFGKL